MKTTNNTRKTENDTPQAIIFLEPVMTPDELVNASLEAASPPKPIADLRRSRFTDGILVAAAQLLLAGERHGEDAEAIHTQAMSRAKISAGHYKSLAGWTKDLIMVAIQHMITKTKKKLLITTLPGTNCERKPMKSAKLATAKLQLEQQTTIPEAPKRRGRPPKNGVAMSNLERQKKYQEKLKSKSTDHEKVLAAIEDFHDLIMVFHSQFVDGKNNEQAQETYENFSRIKSRFCEAIGVRRFRKARIAEAERKARLS